MRNHAAGRPGAQPHASATPERATGAGRRETISRELGQIVEARSQPWGAEVISVELKDVLIPASLEDAMSLQAQAQRERQVAETFQEAALTYADTPPPSICGR